MTYSDADDENEDDHEDVFWSLKLCCSGLQCVVAACCSVLQRVAVWCSDDNEDDDQDVPVSALQVDFVTVCCSAL